MRARNLEKRRNQLKDKFLSEIPPDEQHRYRETVGILVDATIKGYLFEGFVGEALVDHLLVELPKVRGYEHCAYSHLSLKDVLGKYATRVERKFFKYRKELTRNAPDEIFSRS